jgi:hypothetical protein
MIRFAFPLSGEMHMLCRMPARYGCAHLERTMYKKDHKPRANYQLDKMFFPLYGKRSKRENVSIFSNVYLPGGMSCEPDKSARLVLHAAPSA